MTSRSNSRSRPFARCSRQGPGWRRHPGPATLTAASQRRQHLSHRPDLVRVDGVAEAGVNAQVHGRVEPGHHRRGFFDPANRNVRVNIAASDEDRRAVHGAWIVERRSRWADQATAEGDDRSVALCVACGVLQREASALGEAEQGNAAGGDTRLVQAYQHAADQVERRGEIRFIALDWFNEAVGIPRLSDGVRRENDDSGRGHLTGQVDDIGRVRPPAVEGDDRSAGLVESRACCIELSLAMRIGHRTAHTGLTPYHDTVPWPFHIHS